MDKFGNLALLRSVPPDGNPFNPDRIQVSDAPRRTEVEAFLQMVGGRVVETPVPRPTMNGRVVDTTKELMCSRCGQWKSDDAFYRERQRVIRRGRSYYCMVCRDAMQQLYDMAQAARTERQPKRRKKRRKS